MDNRQQDKKWSIGQWVSFAVIGLGIGWLTGLSASPVLAIVLTSILGALGGVVAGLKASRLRTRIDARPLAWIVLGLALAAPLGILARSHRLFGPTPQDPATGQQDPLGFPGLFATAGSAECERLTGSPDHLLRSALQTSRFEWAPALAEAVEDDARLRRLVDALCARR